LGPVDFLPLPGQATIVSFDGGAGQDSAALFGSTAAETVTMTPGTATLTASGLAVFVVNAEEISARGEGGADVARLYDSSGDDTFVANPTYGQLSGAGFSNRAESFRFVTASGGTGGPDTATFHGSPGNETITATREHTRMDGATASVDARAFDKVFLFAGGGEDKATLQDSDGDDHLEAADDWAKLSYDPDHFLHLSELASLARVKAISSRGGSDTKHVGETDYLLETEGPWEAV